MCPKEDVLRAWRWTRRFGCLDLRGQHVNVYSVLLNNCKQAVEDQHKTYLEPVFRCRDQAPTTTTSRPKCGFRVVLATRCRVVGLQ